MLHAQEGVLNSLEQWCINLCNEQLQKLKKQCKSITISTLKRNPSKQPRPQEAPGRKLSKSSVTATFGQFQARGVLSEAGTALRTTVAGGDSDSDDMNPDFELSGDEDSDS